MIVLLLITIPFLYNKHEKEIKDMDLGNDKVKLDFVAFPIKNIEYKIYPLTNIITKNIMADPKAISTTKQIAVVEKTLDVSTIKGVIKLGDSGDNVKYIQGRLVEYGYKLEVDGYFRSLTYDAILNFQYRCKLDIDGLVGLKTLEKLNMPVAKNIEFNTIKPALSTNNKGSVKNSTNNAPSISQLESSINSIKSTSKTNYYIRVDLKNQKVNIFKLSKEKWVLDKSFICSSGKASTPTVKGNFTIKDKGPMFRAGSNTICNYYTQFYGNYLFHTVLLDNNGNIQDGRLGTPLSHGCIRLAIDNAKYIYTTIPYGTSVSIQ